MSKRIYVIFAIIICATYQLTSATSAQASSKWDGTNLTYNLENGYESCWEADSDRKLGDKIVVTYLKGSSKTWQKLGVTTLVAESDCGDSTNLETFNSMPTSTGSYYIRYQDYGSKGHLLWTYTPYDTWLNIGINGAVSDFFTPPPNVVLPADILQAISNNQFYTFYGGNKTVDPYDSKGHPRNTCLIIYDYMAIEYNQMLPNSTFTSYQLINSLEQTSLGTDLFNLFGQYPDTIQDAVTCAPWIAKYFP